MYSLSWTNTFVRTANKFFRIHSDLKPVFIDILTQLQTDPYHKRLKLHSLKGRHKDKHAVSLTYSYRVVIYLRITKKEIVLLDIGSHDEVY